MDVTPDIPQSEIMETNIYKSDGSLGDIILGISVLHLVCRMTQNISPKIPPNLSLSVLWLNYHLKFHLREFLGLWGSQ